MIQRMVLQLRVKAGRVKYGARAHSGFAVPVRGKPWQFKHLTLRHVYFPIAKSSGRVLELLRVEKARDGDRTKKPFQFLSEVGTRALRIQLGRLLEMAESSANQHEYERKVAERFGGQQELELIVSPDASQQPA